MAWLLHFPLRFLMLHSIISIRSLEIKAKNRGMRSTIYGSLLFQFLNETDILDLHNGYE